MMEWIRERVWKWNPEDVAAGVSELGGEGGDVLWMSVRGRSIWADGDAPLRGAC